MTNAKPMTDAKPRGWLTAAHAVGTELVPVAMKLRLDMFAAGGLKTIHNDAEAASREGLAFPIAVGPQVAALIFRMMRNAFGAGWIVGGATAMTFRRPIHSEAFVVARGRVTETKPENGNTRLVCDVWVETESGEKTIVGTASGVVAND